METTMLIKRVPGWALPETAATSEAVFCDRRALIKGFAAGAIAVGAAPILAGCEEEAPISKAAAADDTRPSARW